MNQVYLNGSFVPADQARISPMDRAFLFADGVYEVIPAFNGVLFGAEAHLRRLERSLAALQMGSPYTLDAWRDLCEELLARNGGGDQGVYVQVTRGAPARRDHSFPAASTPQTVFMATSAIAPSPVNDPDNARGHSAITVDDIRWGRCDVKSVALLANVLAKQQATIAGAVEAILIRDGWLTEGSSTNVFVVRNGGIATPPHSTRILGGVTRDLVVQLCRDNGFEVQEREVAKHELYDASELWISSSTKDVMPIVSLDGRSIGEGAPGTVWKRVAGVYLAHKRRVCGALDRVAAPQRA